MVTEPTFLVGAEQSGSTLLRLMLDSHPEVSFAEEFEYTVTGVSADGCLPTTAEFANSVATSRTFGASGFTIDDSLPFTDLVSGFLRSRQEQKGALLVGATIHHGFSRALHIWPNARFIHLVRDPRDVGPARIRAGFSGNIWHALDNWVRAVDEWSAVEELVPADRRMTVHFSDLITDYHTTLTGICQFLGVDYTSQMLNYAQDTDYQEPSPTVAGDWRRYLDDKYVRLAEARVGERLTEQGFEPSGLPPLELTDRDLLRLRRQDRVGRAVKRIGSYGVRLTAADFAARAIGHQEMQQSLKLRFNEVEQSNRMKSWSDEDKYRTSR
ncbi:MAG: sulfotransferase [Actinomycetota bacterium]